MDIGEIVQRSGLPPSTLRYYEEKGLIAPTGRNGLRRQYDASTLERLALIALGRSAGFTLEEIGHMFGPDGRLVVDRALLLSKADALDKTIERLTAMRDGLRHAAVCRAPSHLECPKFQRILGAAARGALGGRAPGRGGKRAGQADR
jgi:DNA-binding transcriptional MerR regulator